jgi:chorismate mutase
MSEERPPSDTPDPRLDELRHRIIEVDEQLIRLIGERRDLVLEVGRRKEELGLPILDPRREAEVVRRAAIRARDLGVDEEMARDVVWRIIAAARAVQEGRLHEWPARRSPIDPSVSVSDPSP